MNQLYKFFGVLSLVAAFTCLAAAPAVAQSEVRMQVSSQETYVGMPVTLRIQVEDANLAEPPEFPEIDGLDIRSAGTPSRNSSVTIINGRRTESNSVVYGFQFTPRREGSFEIPSITVHTSRGSSKTQAFRISATTSETGDLMFAEVAGQKEHLYVGQPIDLTLRIWIKPYQDRQRDITISAADMWRMIAQNTQWGAFADTLEKMAAEGKTIRGRQVLRKDSKGIDRSYYLYEVVATFYPKRAGQIDVEDVQIVAQYPTQLGQSRDPFESFFGDSPFGSMFDDDFFNRRGMSPFGRSLTVTSSRPIVVTPEVAPIEVTPIPTTGRPADYRGAVGQYQMVTQATPVKVKSGDPITLKIGIRGTGPMELVQAPPLAEFPSLTADFKVSDEPLAGVVQDDIKVFTTTIRPRREGITQVPSIPFSFFNPDIEEFVTVHSEPVSIEVTKAEKLALDSIVGAGGGRKRGSSETDIATQAPVLANVSGHRLLSTQSATPDLRFWLGWFVLPAGLLGLFFLTRNRRSWVPQSGARAAITQINRATQARDVSKAILSLIANRLDRPDNLTRPEAIAEVSGRIDAATSQRLDSLLVDCEHAAFTGDETISLNQTKQQARDLVGRLARLHGRVSLKPKAQISRRTAFATALALAVMAVTTYSLFTVFASPAETQSLASQNSGPTVNLDDTQKATLLDEATDAYQRAVELKADDAAESNSEFAKSSQKYQMLVDAGVQNSELYFNLGNAYLQTDSVGRAIANYQRSLKLRPLDFQVRKNLAFAKSLIEEKSGIETSTPGLTMGAIRSWIMELPTSLWLTLLAIGWVGLCVSTWIKLTKPGFRVRHLAIPATIFLLAASGMIAWSSGSDNPLPTAVVVATDVPVYEGSSEAFPQLPNIKMTEGQPVQVIQRRGDWLQIRSATGDQGWTKAELLEQV